METSPQDAAGIRRQQSTLMTGMLIAAGVTIALWLAVDRLLPALPAMADTISRLVFALKCCCAAILLCLVSGIEAVAHERLASDAIDPLSGDESRRMQINLRYLQNTLEQTVLFIPGLLVLSVYCSDGRSMRAVVATTVVWIVSRAAFWIGYHRGSEYRSVGLTGMVQSMLVLLYDCGRFGYDVAGIAGAAAPLILFGGIEAYLVYATRRPPGARAIE
jgi:uncharacterized MAPEG superfamily protein